jgi:hypothetical protein
MALSEREQKQSYLKSEIIDKSLDPESFISFCERSKGADIDLWSLDELKQCVKDFTKHLTHSKSTSADVIECKTLKPSRLSNEHVKVIITTPEKKQGIFNSKLFFYYVVTLPLGWSVQRKFSDFQWLQESLCAEFPGFYVPVITEINAKKLDDALEMAIQMKELTLFMDYVLASDLFKRSASLVTFLQEEERERLRKAKKGKAKKVNDFREISTADGLLCCEYDNLEDFTSKSADFLDQHQICIKKLIHESKNIKRVLGELSVALNSFAVSLTEMGSLAETLTKHSRPMKELYIKFAESTEKISEKVWQSSVQLNEYFIGTMGYFKTQGSSLKNLYKEKDAAFAEMETLKKKISKIVEKDKGVSKEITDKSRTLQEKAGILNYLCRDQTQKMLGFYGHTLFSETLLFVQKLSESITGILTTLAMFSDGLEISKGFL